MKTRLFAAAIFTLLMATSSSPQAPPGPDTVGQWSGSMNLPVVPIHSHLLHTGKVLFWDRHSSSGAAGEDEINPRIWDPVADPGMTAIVKSAHPMLELFCSGHVTLRDGRLFVAGGHNGTDGNGLITAHTYDAVNDVWTREEDMNNGRWYPSAAILANGDVCVASGTSTPGVTNQIPQVFDAATGHWRTLTGANRNLPCYPMLHLAPNGKVFMAGPEAVTRYLDTAGLGSWSTVGNTTYNLGRDYGSSVLYDHGKILLLGGGAPTAHAEVINLNAATPAWRAVPAMAFARRQVSASILADGQVLVTGGTSTPGFNEAAGSVFAGEIWNPDTETFTTVAAMAKHRLYHSETLLLPDGRVLSQGGGHPAATGGTNQFNAEIYSPPYLFRGPRPTITSALGVVAYGQTFAVETPDAASIAKVHLIRLGSATHALNMDQRLCRATFALGPGGLAVTVPSNSSICPPGYYMMFLVNGAGVPSVAKIIKIDGNSAPIANAGTNQTVEANASTGTFVTLNGTGSTDTESNIATYQWSEGPTPLATGAQPSVSLSVGVHTLTLRVTDSLGLFSESTVTVTITDATAPVISLLTANPVVLRPGNGTMTPVTVAATVSDNGDPSPVTKILSVTSTESDPAPSDVQITGNLTVNLRAERFSLVRRYTILVECRDASNNASTKTVTVSVRSKWFP
jgi:hypothetical protein